MKSNEPERMLIVDDEPDMARGILRLLRIKGYDVAIAMSGEEAIEKAIDFEPHGILMDIQMPNMDGVEVYRLIHARCPQAFVIFMTAFSSRIEAARKESAVEVLTKPVDPEQMYELIAESMCNLP